MRRIKIRVAALFGAFLIGIAAASAGNFLRRAFASLVAQDFCSRDREVHDAPVADVSISELRNNFERYKGKLVHVHTTFEDAEEIDQLLGPCPALTLPFDLSESFRSGADMSRTEILNSPIRAHTTQLRLIAQWRPRLDDLSSEECAWHRYHIIKDRRYVRLKLEMRSRAKRSLFRAKPYESPDADNNTLDRSGGSLSLKLVGFFNDFRSRAARST